MELFEREIPLQALEEALEAIRKGEGRIVLVSGEAGIGKTTLVEHFTAQPAEHVSVYWGSCDALFTPRPLGPFSDIAFQMQSGLLDILNTSQDWFRVANAFLAELSKRDSPVIVVIEDIHWADEATFDMLKFLGRRIQHSQILMILTFRDDELDSRHLLWRLTGDLPPRITIRIALAALSEDTVAKMAQNAQRHTEGLFKVTGGNPFFVREMLERESEGVPASVRDLVVGRVSRLSADARELAELVALSPGGIELWILEQDLQTPPEALDECVEVGVLHWNGEILTYQHELARQAVENSLSPGHARFLHSQILHALMKRDPEAVSLARMVHHAALGGNTEVILLWAPQAARQASRLGAHREAATHYQLVLSNVPTLTQEKRAELLEGLSFESYLTGEINTAIHARQEAASIWKKMERPKEEGDDLRWLSRLAWFAGQNKDAEEYAREAIEILEKLPPGLELAMAYSNQSQLDVLSENNAGARLWGERAVDLAKQLNATEVLVHALTNVGTAEIQVGEEIGWDHLAKSLEIAKVEELHDHVGRAYANLSSLAVQERRYVQAMDWLNQGLVYMGEHDLDSYRVYLMGWLARLYFETGNWKKAEKEANDALRLHRGESVIPIPALIVLGHLKVRRGDIDSNEWLEQARSLAMPTAELQRIGPLAAACAEASWWRGDIDQVYKETIPGYELAIKSQNTWTLGQLAYWLWRTGRTDVPIERLADPYRWMILGEWREAANAWARLKCPFEQALALSEGDASAQIEALAIFEQLGAQPAARALRKKMRLEGVKGLPRGPRTGTKANPEGLTSREMEVLAILVEGLSNAEIARRLSISLKTVDHHISTILAKLNVHSRLEAVAAARQKNIFPPIK
jgi:ATP/maltotriose-dependent transcriptional regulator MalT